MIVITLTGDGLARALQQIGTLAEIADRAYALHVAIDPIDNGLKFKLNNGVWTPPARGEIHE